MILAEEHTHLPDVPSFLREPEPATQLYLNLTIRRRSVREPVELERGKGEERLHCHFIDF